MGQKTAQYILIPLSAAVLVGSTSLYAQDNAGGMQAGFSVSPTLRYTDDADGSGVSAQTDLGLTFSTQTRTQKLELGLSSGITIDETALPKDLITNPLVTFGYEIENRDTKLTTGLRYRQAALDTTFITAESVDTGLLTIDSGIRADLNGNVNLEVGRTAPLGATFGYRFAETTYRDTVDPDLLDSRTQGLDGALLFRIDPRITLRLTGTYSDRDVDDGVDLETRNAGLGAEFAINQRLTADIALGYSEVIRDGLDPVDDTSEEGVNARIALTQAMPNGTLSGSISSDIDTEGRRTTLEINRAMELANDGSLTLSFGLSEQDDFGVDPVYGLTYARSLKRSQVTAAISQTFGTDEDGDQSRDTLASFGYTQALSNTSGINLSLSLRDRTGLSGDLADAQRLDLGLSYNQALSADWSVVGGYNRSFAKEDGADDTSSDSIFVGISREFNWRP